MQRPEVHTDLGRDLERAAEAAALRGDRGDGRHFQHSRSRARCDLARQVRPLSALAHVLGERRPDQPGHDRAYSAPQPRRNERSGEPGHRLRTCARGAASPADRCGRGHCRAPGSARWDGAPARVSVPSGSPAAYSELSITRRILCFEEIAERRFGSWTMGHVSVATIDPSLLLKYATLPVLNPFNRSGQASMALFDELMARASVVGG